MERIVYRISLDATKSGIQGTLQGFMTGDILSRRIEITLAYRGESVALTESETAVMYIHKTGAETPSINSCTIDGDKVIYDVLQSDVDTAGITKMQLKIVSGEQILMSPYFAIEVTDSMTGDTQAVTTPTYSALETALAQAQTVYNSRLISVELGEDLIFTATYADGTIYTSDAIANEIGGVSEAEAARIIAEENRVLAESKRANEFATMKNDVQSAINTTTELQDEVNSLIDSNVVTTEDRQKWDGKADGLSYVGSKLSLLNGEEVLKSVEIIGGGGDVVIPDKVLTATNVTATEAVTPVMNAELFGSRRPEEFALKEELTIYSLPRKSFSSLNEIETFLNNYSSGYAEGIVYEFEVNGVAGYELGDGVWYISGTKFDSSHETQDAKRYSEKGAEIKRRSKYNGAWSGWVADVNALDLANITNGTTKVGNAKTLDGHEAEYFAPLTELSNYFKNTGGIVNGNVTVKADDTSQRIHALQNSARRVFQTIGTSGNYNLYDGTNNKAIIVSTADGTNTFNGTASGNLPLTGGMVTKNGTKVMGIHNTNSVYTLFEFYGQGTELGSFGFDGVDNPVFRPVGGGIKKLIHTGNKPTGTYTGNGDATSRTVNLGGIGTVVYISGGGYGVFVTQMGGIVFAYDGRAISALSNSEIKFAEGVLTIATTNSAVNASGTNHSYQVL